MSSTFINHINSQTLAGPPTILEEEEQGSLNMGMQQCSISSSNIDIQGRPVSSDILVALLDRPNEMRQLASRNTQFYRGLETYVTETQGNFAWQRFQDIVYKPREKLSDRAWMNQISHFLAHNPIFFSKFKESVGYQDNEQIFSPPAHPGPPPHKSISTGSSSSSAGRRRSRRLSSVSFGDLVDHQNDFILQEEAPQVPEGMFTDEDEFLNQFSVGRRRRSSYHSIQSEPHPTFVDSKIDEEEEEAQVERHDEDNESDHLADLLDDDSSDSDDEDDKRRLEELGFGAPTTTTRHHTDMDLIKLRDYPDIQINLPTTHAQFFRKAQQLICLAPSSRRFCATVRRNSILEDAMPPSPVTELDEPRLYCTEDQQDDNGGDNLAHLICSTRRQQPDDVAWLNGVTEALDGWPELVDQLHDIVNESLEEQEK